MSQTTLSGGAAPTWRLRRKAAPDAFTAVSILLAVIVIGVTAAAVLTVLARLFFVDGSFTLSGVSTAFKSTDVWGPLKNTAIVVGVSTVFAVVLGALLAWINERTDARMGLFSDVAPMATFLMPPVAGCIGFTMLFSPQTGYVNQGWNSLLHLVGISGSHPILNAYGWTGLIAVFAVYGVPFTYTMIAPAMRLMDSSLEEASKVFGAGGLRTTFRVTLPGILPAVGAGAFLWIWIACSMVEIPLLIGSPSGIYLLAPQIVNLLKYGFPPNEAGAVGLSTIITVIVVVVWVIQRRILRAGHHAQIGAKGAKNATVKLGRWRWLARLVVIAYAAGTTVLPGLALLYVSLAGSWREKISLKGLSFDEFTQLFTQEGTLKGLVNSFVLSFVAATVVVLIAAIISLYVARSKNLTGKLVDLGVKIPGTIGALIIVLGILLLFAGHPFYLGGGLLILLIAFVLLSLPNASVASDAAVAGVGESLSEASRMSGAPEGRTFFKVVLPLLIPGLVGAWASVFVRCISDVSASSLLAGTANPVIGFQILDQSRYGSYAGMASLSVVLAVVSAVVVLGTVWFGRFMSRWTTSGGTALTASAPSTSHGE